MGSGAEHDPARTSLRLPPGQAAWMSAQAGRARWPLRLATAAPLLAGALLLPQAWLLARVLDRAIAAGAGLAQLWPWMAAIAGLMVARAGLAWLGERAGSRAAETIKAQVRQALFAGLLARSPGWTRARASGELASALVEQVDALEGYFARFLPAMAAAGALPLAFGLALIPVDAVAGLLLLATAPLIPLFMALAGWGAEAASRRHLQAFARLSGFFADRVRGLSTLKLYGRAQAEADAAGQATRALRDRTMAVLRIAFLSSAVLEFFAALGVAGVALYVGLSYLGFLDLRMTPLTLQAGLFCLLMAPEVYLPLRQLAAHYHDRAAARAAVAGLAQAFGTLPESGGSARSGAAAADASFAAAPSLAAHRPLAVDARGLTLRAPGRTQPVVASAALHLAPGAWAALTGASGAGKTTLLEALARLRPAQGAVALGGRPLADWPEDELRRRVALISQRPYLHPGSIAENIALADPHADAGRIARAARLACVDEFAERLPQGLDTPLGPRGYGLSGGQAQRVALARLYLREPGLILLDEPTAHLDPATRDRVLDALLDFARGRTLVLATHDEAVAARLPLRLSVRDAALHVLRGPCVEGSP